MDRKEVQEGEYDSGGTGSVNYWDNQFNVYRESFKKLEDDIISTRNCLDYVLSISISDLDYINSLLIINQNKVKLIKEISNKLDLMNDKKNVMFNDYLNLIKKYENYCKNLKSD